MKKVIGFYRTFLQTLNPKSYEGFSESTAKNTFNYFAAMVFSSFVIMLIVLLPVFVQLPSKIEPYFDKFESLSFTSNIKTKEPILIPETNPKIIINYNNQTPTQSANIINNNNVLYGGFLFTKFVKDFSAYKDVKANSPAISAIIAFILLLMLPTLLLILFFYVLLKFFAIAVITAILALLVAPAIGYKINFKKLFNTAMYGISLTVLLDLVFFAIGFSLYYIQYLPLVVYMVYGIIYGGDKIDKKMKGKFLEVKG